MALCACNKPDCTQCLIQNTVPEEPVSFMRTEIDTVIFVIRSPERHVNERTRELSTAKLWAAYSALDNLGFLLQESGFTTSLTTRSPARK